jgi:hypothetical protein
MRARQVALALLLAALQAPATAAARWGPTQDLGPLPIGYQFAYDGNARGDRIAVWQTTTGFAFAQARPGADLGPVRTLPDQGGPPHVKLDESGNALMVWTYSDGTEEEELRGGDGCCNGLRARVIRRDGSFSATKTLAPTGNEIAFADAQFGPGGAFGVVFHRLDPDSVDGAVEARFGTVARGFGPREQVVASRTDVPVSLAFVRRRARLTYATSTGFGSDTEPVVFRELERKGRGRYETLASPGRSSLMRNSIQFATTPGGEQVVTWMRAASGNSLLQQAVYAGTRRLGRRFRFRKLADESAFYRAPVAIEPGGNALTAWDSARQAAVVTSLRRPRADFAPLTRMNSYDEPIDLGTPAVDVNARRHGLLAWTERGLSGGPRLVGAFRNSRGTAIEHHVIEPEGSLFEFYGTGASLDRAGRGYVAYGGGGRLKVIAARIGG